MDSPYFDSIARSLFPRDCVLCPNVAPICDDCPAQGKVCNIISQSCTACAHSVCVDPTPAQDPTATPGASSGGGSNIGGIVGGVVGGVAAIAILTALIYFFIIRKRRYNYYPGSQDDPFYGEKMSSTDFASRRDARMSTHTVGSIASTVMTRGSQVIPIAYIPGIENRSDAQSLPYSNAPPVPRIAPEHLHHANGDTPPRTPYTDADGQFFFTDQELRGSTYTQDDGDARQSTYDARQSQYRASVASTIYRSNAIVSPVPAQQALRARANVVSVRSSPNQTPATQTSPQHFEYVDYGASPTVTGPVPDILRSLTAEPAPPMPERNATNAAAFESPNPNHIASLLRAPVSSRSGRSSPSNTGESALSTLHETDLASATDSASPSEPSLTTGSTPSGSEDGSAPWTGPLTDARGNAIPSRGQVPADLAAVIEDATRRAGAIPRHGGLGSVGNTPPPASQQHSSDSHDSSPGSSHGPFSDEHAV